MQNPFKPTFGVSPPLLVGRDEMVEEFRDAIEDGPGAPGRATIYTGPRGVGKTVMLNKVQALALEQGWIVISETATPGFLARLVNQHLPALLSEFDPNAKTTKMSGLTAPMGLGATTWTNTDKYPIQRGFRNQITQLADLLAANGTGVLISLDEIHYQQIDELREFGATIQHLFREEKEVAFVGAGLPSAVSDVLNDSVLTFLHRAERFTLGPVSLDLVSSAISKPIQDGGRSINSKVCDKATEATGGYPFLIQLVGYYIWKANQLSPTISLNDAEKGIAKAHRKMGSLIYEPTLASTSDIGRTFLSAMAQDEGSSNVSDIASRLKVSAQYIGQYRARLIDAGLIKNAGWGKVDFVLPDLRKYLQEHAVTTYGMTL
jgi:hypothetical protein